MKKLYREQDADTSILQGKKIAVIGYGAQGKAQSLMMHDSGLDIVVGVREGGPSDTAAQADGLKTMSIAEASKSADIIHVLIPDEIQAEVFEKDILPGLEAGNTLSFSHGFNIVFKKITPPEGVNVIMVAPKSPGTEERKVYLQGFGVPALIAIEKDETGNARDIALAMSKAMHFTKAGVLECSFADEAHEDLFGEQAVLCGGASGLVKAGFEVLTEAGYPPEMAYFECLHELKLIVDLMYEGGIAHMYDVVSNTAEFGGRCFEGEVNNEQMKEVMRKYLKNIESGSFAEKWLTEYKNGMPNMKKWREEEKKHPIEVEGKKVRALFDK